MRGQAMCVSLLILSLSFFAGCFPQATPIEKKLDLVYKTVDGTELCLDYMAPKGAGPFPLVVSVHGGGWQRGSYKEYTGFQENCAKSGIASISVQYRFAPKAKFPAQLEDVQDALKFVLKDKKKFPVDSDRVAWLGGSAGAHLALLAGLLEDLLGTVDKTADIYRAASPVEIVATGAPRVFTVHGEKDDIVPIEQAEELHIRLKELGIPENFFRSKEGTHNFAAWPVQDRNEALLEMVKELNSALLKK